MLKVRSDNDFMLPFLRDILLKNYPLARKFLMNKTRKYLFYENVEKYGYRRGKVGKINGKNLKKGKPSEPEEGQWHTSIFLGSLDPPYLSLPLLAAPPYLQKNQLEI